MQIISRPCGAYGTNCYIINNGERLVVIDPGDGAIEFVRAQNLPVAAVLNTHGHFDHVANNAEVVDEFKCPLYTPEDDVFMLANPNGYAASEHLATAVKADSRISIEGFGDFIFHHFPGHTPGCSLIEWKGQYFSGDFLFSNTIGRCDFEYSNPADMKRSLIKAQGILQPGGFIRPGHGLGAKSENVIAQIPEFLAWF